MHKLTHTHMNRSKQSMEKYQQHEGLTCKDEKLQQRMVDEETKIWV